MAREPQVNSHYELSQPLVLCSIGLLDPLLEFRITHSLELSGIVLPIQQYSLRAATLSFTMHGRFVILLLSVTTAQIASQLETSRPGIGMQLIFHQACPPWLNGSAAAFH